jgi:lysophospholipase L1-like esterase
VKKNTITWIHEEPHMEKIRQYLRQEQPVKWLFYGDSITHGVLHTWGDRDYTQLFAERVRAELGRSQDIVLNTAISGNRTTQLMEQFDWRVRQFEPDVVFLMIGMNDCAADSGISVTAFDQNLRELHRRFAECNALPIYQTTCPILPGSAPSREPSFSDFMDAIRGVAADTASPLIDHEKFRQEHAAQPYFWMSNAFHPNGYGHRAFAYLLFRELGIHDPASLCCQLFFPGM